MNHQVLVQKLKTPNDPDPKSIPITQTPQKTGLIIEENPMIAKLIKSFFVELGCQIDIVASGKEAIIQTQTKDYNFVLMSIGLPGRNGFDMTKTIRLLEGFSKHRTFIIGVTAYATEKEKQLALKAGMDLLLTKPVTLEMARDLLNNFIPSTV